MDHQGTNPKNCGTALRLFRLLALLVIGAYAGYEFFSIVFDQRDGIHMEYVAWQLRGTMLGAITGLLLEIAWRQIRKHRFPAG